MGKADVALLTNFAVHKAAALSLSPSLCLRLHSFLLQSENNWTSALESTNVEIMWDVFCSHVFKHLQEVSLYLSSLKSGVSFFFVHDLHLQVLVVKCSRTRSWKCLEITQKSITLSHALNASSCLGYISEFFHRWRDSSELLSPVKRTISFLVRQFSWIDHWTSYQAPLTDLQVAFMLQKLMAFIHANHFSIRSSRKCSACFRDYF